MKKIDVYKKVTDKLIEMLYQGTIPWRQPWNNPWGTRPTNLATGNPYKGINVWLLSGRPYAAPYWITYKQAASLGGNVRRGEKSSAFVAYWGQHEKKNKKTGEITDRYWFLRYTPVFNVEQCEGLTVPEPSPLPTAPERAENAERYIDGYLSHGGPRLKAYRTDRAFYRPLTDLVEVPEISQFSSAAEYYSIVFHELGHSTGAKNRLSRPGITDFDSFASHQYSKEELIAEMTAAFLSGVCGFFKETADSNAAYIAAWIKQLSRDPKLAVQAASKAQAAADWIIEASEAETVAA